MFLEVSCMALLNAQLPDKTNAKLASTVLCFVTPRDRKGKFQKPIICAIMQDRAVIYAKSQLGSFFGGIKNRAVLCRETERIEPTKPEKIG